MDFILIWFRLANNPKQGTHDTKTRLTHIRHTIVTTKVQIGMVAVPIRENFIIGRKPCRPIAINFAKHLRQVLSIVETNHTIYAIYIQMENQMLHSQLASQGKA